MRQKLQKLEGTDINFYEYVGVKRGISATTEEIASAYRRKSLAWQYVPSRSLLCEADIQSRQEKERNIKKRSSRSIHLVGVSCFLKESLIHIDW